MAQKIIYLANMRLPNERPHGIQIMKTCEALKKQGIDIELWVAARQKSRDQNTTEAFSFYGVHRQFPVRALAVLDFLPTWWKVGFYLESISFLLSAFFALRRLKENFVIYTRDEIISFLVFFTERKIFWESHMTLRSNFLAKKRIEKLAGITAISRSLKNIICAKYGLAPEKIVVAHDAVDLGEFGNSFSINEARNLLGLPIDKQIAVYSGGLFKQKGIFTLLEAAALMDSRRLFLIVGGNPGDQTREVKEFIAEHNLKNVKLTGHVPPREVKNYLAAADVFVLPNSNLDERTRLFTSPMKLFEYMASGRPIVASATPTIKEVLNESSAVLVEPDNPRALQEGLLEIFNDCQKGELLAQNAGREVKNYTWDKRAEKIKELFK